MGVVACVGKAEHAAAACPAPEAAAAADTAGRVCGVRHPAVVAVHKTSETMAAVATGAVEQAGRMGRTPPTPPALPTTAEEVGGGRGGGGGREAGWKSCRNITATGT